MSCVGCGQDLDGVEACPRCGTSAVGARFDEELTVTAGSLTPLDVCCCCLAPDATLFAEPFEFHLFHTSRATVKLTWCDECRSRRRLLRWITGTSFVGCSVIGIWILSRLGKNLREWETLAMIGAAIFAAATLTVLVAHMPAFRPPGHVPGCDAASGSYNPGTGLVRLRLGNRAFATLWRRRGAS